MGHDRLGRPCLLHGGDGPGNGVRGVDDLLVQVERIGDSLRARQPLSRLDWLRALLATEVCFVSNIVGPGLDSHITSGVSNEETIRLLRSVQRRLTREVYGLVGGALGTRARSHTDEPETD